MKKAYSLLKGFRLSVTVPASLLVRISFFLSNQQTNWLEVFVMFFICGTAMLQNDYFDRSHDILKQKKFASENPRFLLITCIILWSLVVSIICFKMSDRIFLFAIVITCILYSFSRRFLLLPTLIVAILSALPVLAAVLRSPMTYSANFFLFFAVAFGIFGREILKDIEDYEIDKGYKRTLLTENCVNKMEARKIAALSIFVGMIFNLFLLNYLFSIQLLLFITANFFLLFSIVILFSQSDRCDGKTVFDIGMALTILSLLF